MKLLKAIVLILVCLNGALGQAVKLSIDSKTATVLGLIELDRTAFRAKSGVDPEPASVILINKTNRAIVALTAIWATPDPKTGRPHREILSTDIYQGPNLRPIIVANSNTVIGPSTLLSEDGKGFRGKPSPRQLERYAAAQTTVTIDAVIFEDGELVGPDTRNLAADLIARKQAANILLARIRSANGSKQAVLDAAAVRAQSREELRLTNHLRGLAGDALNMLQVTSIQGIEQWLASMPEPVHAFRK
jgi:hypothetical protein